MMTNTRALDLNEYEGRAYLALLGRGAVTAYELGRHAGIPLSRCYEVARALARKGFVLVQPGDAPRYRAVDPAEVLARHRAERARELDALEAELLARARTQAEAAAEAVWVLRGRSAILARAGGLVSAARTRLSVSAPPDALAQLEAELDAARARGVLVRALEDERALVVERDGAEALLGELGPDDACLATLTSQPGVAAWLARRGASARPMPSPPAPTAPEPGPTWIDWETSKVRRLLATVPALADLESE